MLNLRESGRKHAAGIAGFLFYSILRFLQFIMGVTVCGLYARDLSTAFHTGMLASSKWLYAVIVGGLSALTALVFAIPFVKEHVLFVWDWILFLLWTAVFGVFARLFLRRNPESMTPISDLDSTTLSMSDSEKNNAQANRIMMMMEKSFMNTSVPLTSYGITLMKNAVWINMINMILWFLTAFVGTFLFFFARRLASSRRSQEMGSL